MTDATAAFKTAYEKWLRHYNLRESTSPRDYVGSNRRIIIGLAGNQRGTITRVLGKLRLCINFDTIQHLKINKLTYLSVPEDYQIDILSAYGYRNCWLDHTRNTTDTCYHCVKAKYNLRCVRAAGYTWLLIDIMHDVKHLIARTLSLLALPRGGSVGS